VTRCPFWLAALVGLTASVSLAVEPDEILTDPALEVRARILSAGLRCLVCQNQSIDDSTAPLARDLRVLIRERLKGGSSDEDIEAFIVARYGDFLLLKPRFTAHTVLLWLAPFLILGLGGFGLLRRRRHREAPLERALAAEERQALRVLAAGDDGKAGDCSASPLPDASSQH
jgi:cytochrome c-type biogenesis protein CcmH